LHVLILEDGLCILISFVKALYCELRQRSSSTFLSLLNFWLTFLRFFIISTIFFGNDFLTFVSDAHFLTGMLLQAALKTLSTKNLFKASILSVSGISGSKKSNSFLNQIQSTLS
jgi:hypothetical protein